MALGFALGGFFDGILLHQILQWHHLLSLVPGVDTLRAQILWDGYFHAFMYVIAAASLWGLWRARGNAARQGRQTVGALMIGFGLWHVIDAILSHWLLGIHRIRLDVPNPLVWDLIWFVAFGLVPVFAGWLLRRTPPPSSGAVRPAALSVLVLTLLTSSMALWSLQAPPGQSLTTVVFAAGISPAEAVSAVIAADARLVWADSDFAVIVIDVAAGERLRFYRHGALLVGGSGLTAGCFNWVRA